MNTTSFWRYLTAAMLLGLLAGCNTMEGAGRDLAEAGEAIEDEAEEHNGYTEPYDDY